MTNLTLNQNNNTSIEAQFRGMDNAQEVGRDIYGRAPQQRQDIDAERIMAATTIDEVNEIVFDFCMECGYPEYAASWESLAAHEDIVPATVGRAAVEREAQLFN